MITFQIYLILFCLLANAFFSGIETGLISINRLKLRPHVEAGESWAVLIQDFLDNPSRMLGTTLLGTNLTMIMGSILAASVGTAFLPHAGEIVSGTLMTLVVLVACEYTPKAWFRAHPTARVRHFIVAFQASARVLAPLVRFVTLITDWIIRDPEGQTARSPVMTREDLIVLTQESLDSGLLTAKQRIMILRVADLSETTPATCMMPLARIAVVADTATVSEFYVKSRESGFSSVPVFSQERKEFVGLANLYDVLPAELPDSAAPITRYMKPVLFVKYNAPLTELFPLMRRARQSLCLVTGAKGEVVGLLTSEDILRLIVGSL
jgi:putative hemolysin